jgi:hypothetical protein
MRAQISNREYEQISAYLDGQLSSNEQHKLEERLKTRPDLQIVLDDLRRTKNLLRMAPHRRAPRNFMLTPTMVGQQKSKKPQSSFLNFFPALSFASALAVFALVLSFVFQLIPGTLGSPASFAANPQAKEVAMSPANGQSATPSASEQRQSQSQAANPAAPEAAVMEAQNSGTPTSEITSNAQENSAAPDNSGSAPPIIVWNGNPGRGGGGGGDGNSVEQAPAPKDVAGVGGGAPGDAQLLPSDGIVIPLEGVNSIETSQPPTEAAPSVTAQDTFAEQGGGPILGLPPADQVGAITNSTALEGAGQNGQGVTGAIPAESTLSAGISIRLIQVLLALFAIVTGVAAFLLRKRNVR